MAVGRALSLAVDARGDPYIAGANQRIPRVPGGAVTVVAGEADPVAVTVMAAGRDGNLVVANGLESGVATLVAAATPVISFVRTVYAGATLSQNAWVEIRGSDLVPADPRRAGGTGAGRRSSPPGECRPT